MSKHEDIIEHILSLNVGTRISVRGIANELCVSDGTAYKAIKDCDELGIVTTIPRIGTIRTEKSEKKSIEAITFGEIVNIVNGTILGGKDGIYKTLNKFVIGAMTIDGMKKYMAPGDLLIVGNREEAQNLALQNECGVLITGGFNCSDEIKKLAKDKCLPVISSSFDTFTVATMINKVISENIIKKDILFVEDIMETLVETLYTTDKVSKLKLILEETGLKSYPVLDQKLKLEGIISTKHCMDESNECVTKYMSKDFKIVTPKTTVAYAAHIMGWEGIEICPVLDGKILIGIITRQSVLKALQQVARQTQVNEVLDDLIMKNFVIESSNDHEIVFSGRIIPQMLDPIGTASWSSLNMLFSTMGIMVIRQKNNIDLSLDSVITYFMKPVQIDNEIHAISKIIDIGRNFCKVEVTIYDIKNEIIGKSLMSAKILRK